MRRYDMRLKRKIILAVFLLVGLLFLVPQKLYSVGTGFKTWWVYLFYIFIFLLMSYFIVKVYSRKLQKEKQRLEKIVKERTIEIQEKNRQLEKQTLQLKEQSEKFKEIDMAKSRFFTNLSHEFRIPLTLIMGPMEQMLAQTRDKVQKEQLNIMLQNSKRLLTLVNQLLDLSRIDSGKMKLQASPQNIISFLEGILTTFNVLAQHNQLELEFYSKEEKIILYFDTEKMEEVMTNLLINAIQFTSSGGKITVLVTISRDESEDRSLSPGFVEISVKDTGIGIPENQLPRIFDRFYQAESSISRKEGYASTGIGLVLTRELVLLHHGRIEVRSEEDKGTEFIIRLPMGKEHLSPHEIVSPSETSWEHRKPGEISAAYMIEKEEHELETAYENGKLEKEIDKGLKLPEKNTILVVDDNSIFRKYIRERLKPLYTVVDAVDGGDGINKAKEIIPDLIISDVMMPGIDGYKLCNVLKKDVKTSHIPVILLTVRASEESIIHGLETGADDYITKPFNTKILIARIKNLIDQRRQSQLKLQKQETLPSSGISVSSIDETFLKEFRDIIEKNLSNPDFSEDQLGLELHMSQGTLSRKIQALTGETPGQYIQSYRLDRAAQLLKANFGNVSEVAFEVGFSNTAQFAKCFKERFHQLPTSFQTSGLQGKSSQTAGEKEK
ncbi:MAG: response regulator [Candidatus Aminicenantes bacterium]|nr:MAG: response regulator [Candidatus Aminicenantes bacterium]